MLRLEKVNGKNVWELLKLKVADDQKSFVATNDISIIEAYTAITGNGYAFPFGIYDDETPVGFLMIGFDSDDYWDDAPEIANGNYNLWRLMIDKKYQGKGYGREAIKLALDLLARNLVVKLNIAGFHMNRKTKWLLLYIVLLASWKLEKWTARKLLQFWDCK